MTTLSIGNYTEGEWEGCVSPRCGCALFSKLGVAIGQNTHLTTLKVHIVDIIGDMPYSPSSVMKKGQFVDDLKLKLNSSINKLHLICRNCAGCTIGGFRYNHIVCRIAHRFLKAYHTNNNNLTELSIHYADLQNGGDDIIWKL